MIKLNLPDFFSKADEATKNQLFQLAVEKALGELENSVNLVEHNLAVLADSLENLTDLFKHSQEPKQKPAISTSQAPFAIVNPTKSEPKQEPAKSQSWLDLLLNRRK